MCGADTWEMRTCPSLEGSSPRVRSRQRLERQHRWQRGIISACAEQTWSSISSRWRTWDHLRVCGADVLLGCVRMEPKGSSPRVRSRPRMIAGEVGELGIISACAEQTTSDATRRRSRPDHLRVCGADAIPKHHQRLREGSSPRVRSRPQRAYCLRPGSGIISACAEQTLRSALPRGWPWDHLRVCGADMNRLDYIAQDVGSSPRVRSRHLVFKGTVIDPRIISACAEQTRSRGLPKRLTSDHLRVCGADPGVYFTQSGMAGSSPRVRSRLVPPEQGVVSAGIISACAEQTPSSPDEMSRIRDHLRVCGADREWCERTVSSAGSSPRVRSRPVASTRSPRRRGIISACAEQTR